LTTTTGQKIASVNFLTSSSSTILADVYNVFSISSITSLTMPATGTNGATTTFFNDSNYNATLTTNTGQTFYLYNSIGGTNTVVLTPGATISFVYNSSGSAWYASAMNYGLTPITAGGTNATTATAALTNLGGMATSTYDAAGINQQVIGTTATQTLSNKTLVAPNLGTPTAIDLTNATNRFKNNAIYKAVLAGAPPIYSNGSNTVVFDTTVFATGGILGYNSGGVSTSYPTYIVATTPGYYQVNANCEIATTSGVVEVQIWTGFYSTGSVSNTNQHGTSRNGFVTTGSASAVSEIVYIDTTTTNAVFIQVYQNSGSTSSILSAAPRYNYLSIALIGQ
jgi:hypothetical protein